MIIILDTSAILAGIDPGQDIQTMCPPGVVDELQSRPAQRNLEILRLHGLQCRTPEREWLEHVRLRVEELGEATRLSETDLQVLALAFGTGGMIYSDDYSIQNIAASLDLPFRSVEENGISHIRSYRYRCKGCGRIWDERPTTKDCPICGSAIRTTPFRTARAGKRGSSHL